MKAEWAKEVVAWSCGGGNEELRSARNNRVTEATVRIDGG